jgi:hypothetical protein
LFDRGVNAGANRRNANTKRKLVAATTQSQLQRGFRAGIEMLVKAIRRRA